MASFESNESNVVEVDGICFETVVSERVLTIPDVTKRGILIPVQLGIHITNNTQTSFYFSSYAYSFFPEMITPDGQLMGTGMHCERLNPPIESDYVLVNPGAEVTLSYNAVLFWMRNRKKKRDRKLELWIPVRDGDFYVFSPLNPGTYQFRFKYKEAPEHMPELSRWIESTILENLWLGEALTPFIEIHLVESSINLS